MHQQHDNYQCPQVRGRLRPQHRFQRTAAAASQDPIVGKWSITGASGNSAQVVFGADGSFTGYLNGGSQVMRSGTWQNIGGGKYTVTIKGQSAPVTWVLDATSNTAYNAAYPTLVYSPVS